MLSLAVSAGAQNYPFPGAQSDPPVLCTGCGGNNSHGEVNDGKPTFPYDSPLSVHAGRFVDSATTRDIQNVGMRTVRAGIVRVVPGRNRIYLALGAAIGAYNLDTFLTDTLQQPMVAVNTIPTGNPYGGRSPGPYERLAKPHRFFYAESRYSGWTTGLFDVQNVLLDFDTDDRGYVYPATANFGWGIVSDPGGTDGTHLPSGTQVTTGHSVLRILSLRHGTSYYVYYSNGDFASGSAYLADVTTPAAPVYLGSRSGKGFYHWSKYDQAGRVAVQNKDQHVRVYTYAGLIADAAPLMDFPLSSGRRVGGLSFDEDGNLWIVEQPQVYNATIFLWKLTPSGNGYTATSYEVTGNMAFQPTMLHAAGGYIAVGGRSSDETTNATDLRLLRVVSGVPELLDTNGFFLKYYDRAPSGYAEPVYGSLNDVQLLTQAGKTYLFYGAHGLGDVYELGSGPRITSMAPLSGIPAGGTNVSIYGTGFAAGSTVTFDGILASSTFISATQMNAVSPMHASGSVNVIVMPPGASAMTAPKKFTYELNTPQQFVATATSTTNVGMSWNSVAGATHYEVSRRAPDGTWSVIGTPSGTSLDDGGRTSETTYVYRVRAADAAANFSAYSASDLATTVIDDSAIVVGALIRAADFVRLLSHLNSVRAAAGLPTMSFSGMGIGEPVRAYEHINHVRFMLDQGRTTLGLGTATYTENAFPGGAIKALHLNQMFDSMR